MSKSNVQCTVKRANLSLLLLPLQGSQPLLLFPLLLLQGLTSFLQLQIPSLKVFPLLILKCHCRETKRTFMKWAMIDGL